MGSGRIGNSVRRLALLLALVVCAAGPVGAQEVKQGATKSKQYVVQYTLVVLLVFLGLAIVCRPSNRLEEPPFQKEI